MAGHSQFKNIMHRKGRQDAQRAKIFTKLIREITTAARLGAADPNANPRLRAAMIAAREANMTRDTIDRAIKRGSGSDADANYEEIRYEGYGPAGVALIVEALTNNRNRTAGEVRSIFSKHGGNLGESNSVSFMFDRVGEFRFPLSVGSADEVLEKSLGQPSVAKLTWRPKTTSPVEGETVQTLLDLIAALEDNDDVQNVYANFEVSDDALAKFAA